MSGRLNYIRNSVLIINVLFAVVAIIIIVIGIKISSKYDGYEAFLYAYHTRPVQMFTVIGIMVLLSALLGMIGAAKYNIFYLNMQNAFLFALLIMEFAVVVTGIIVSTDINTPIQTKMLQSIPKFEMREKVKNNWNYVQETTQCCGVHSPDDWHITSSSINNGAAVNRSGVQKTYPYSCCTSYHCGTGNVYEEGCISHVVNYVSNTFEIVTFAPIPLMVLQVVLVVLSYQLVKHIRQSRVLQEEQPYAPPNSVSFFISSTSILDKPRF